MLDSWVKCRLSGKPNRGWTRRAIQSVPSDTIRALVLECEINENTKNFALHGVGSALSIFHFLKGNANRYFDQSGTGCVFYQSRKDALVARKAILRISKFSFYVFRREEAEKLINKYFRVRQTLTARVKERPFFLAIVVSDTDSG